MSDIIEVFRILVNEYEDTGDFERGQAESTVREWLMRYKNGDLSKFQGDNGLSGVTTGDLEAAREALATEL